MIADPSKPLLEGALGPGAGSSLMTHKVQKRRESAAHPADTPGKSSPRRSQKLLQTAAAAFPEFSAILQDIYRDAGGLSRMDDGIYVSGDVPGLRRKAAAALRAWRCA